MWRHTNRENHELLHGEAVAGVGAAVDDVEGRDGEDLRREMQSGAGSLAVSWLKGAMLL